MVRTLNLQSIEFPCPYCNVLEVLEEGIVWVDFFWYFCLHEYFFLLGVVSYLFLLFYLTSCMIFIVMNLAMINERVMI